MDTVFCRVVEDFVSTFPSFSFFFYTSLTSAGVYRLSAAVGDLVVVVESEVSGAPFPNETTAAVCQSAADFGIWNPKKKNKISAATSMKKEVRQKKKRQRCQMLR